jgi:hypothetical protein
MSTSPQQPMIAELRSVAPRVGTWDAFARYLTNVADLLVCLPPEERAALDRWELSPEFTATHEWPGWEKYREFLGPRPVSSALKVVGRRR